MKDLKACWTCKEVFVENDFKCCPYCRRRLYSLSREKIRDIFQEL